MSCTESISDFCQRTLSFPYLIHKELFSHMTVHIVFLVSANLSFADSRAFKDHLTLGWQYVLDIFEK